MRAEKIASPHLCKHTGIGDAETGGFALSLPKAEKVEMDLRDTLHGSRPNLRHCDLDGRILPTPSDVSDKGASTKRYARRK